MLTGPNFIPQPTSYALILCHGYGADGADLSYGMDIIYKHLPNTACFYPNAPNSTPFSGYEWFHLNDYTPLNLSNISYIDKLMERAICSSEKLKILIDHIHHHYHLPYDHIILGGFSQGGLMALMTALQFEHKLAGIIALSSVPIVFQNTLPLAKVKHSLPILLTHGDEDPIIPIPAYELLLEELKKAHQVIQSYSFNNLTHGINSSVISHMLSFCKKNFQIDD